MRQYPSQTRPAARPGFDLMTSKLRRPAARPGTIPRSALIGRLAAGGSPPIVSVVAPSGYGKTTLLAQWAARDGEAFAWVSLDDRDNDPKVLLSYVAAALDSVQPVGDQVFEALASNTSSVPGTVVPRLGSAFWSMTAPVVLVLDDAHLLWNTECRDALSVLADHVPPGSRLILAGRDTPPLRIARLRVEGRILEIGPAELSLSRQEAASLLHAADVPLGDDDVAALHQRTEGWAAGLYLAALYLREGGSVQGAEDAFGGDDRLVSQYMESEFLGRISARHREFLTRTAVLNRMCGPLCEAVLDQPGSAAELAELVRSNLLLVPLDRRGFWFRYHHLFRDMLLAELERLEPGLLPVLRRRAAAWCEANGLPEEALEYAMAAGDVDAAARLAQSLWVPTDRQGRFVTLQRWFRWLDDRDGIARYPLIAVWAAVLAAETGRPAQAERWADIVDSWQYGDSSRPADPVTEAWAGVLRAIMCRRGVEQMRTDADEAVRKFTAANTMTPVAPLFQALARILSDDHDGSDALLEDAVRIAEEVGAHEVQADALCERSLLAMANGDWSRAETLAAQARDALRPIGMEALLASAVLARAAVYRGDLTAARRELVSAQRLRPLLTYAIPHLAVQARIQLIHVHLAFADIAGARTLLREIEEILKRRPGLGTLVDEALELRARLSAERGPATPGMSSLTTAELRVLPMLATHLSFPEIGAEMFLSPHTVKSQAMSIYRKLGASSRNQAVIRSRELGLLEGIAP
ncbi:MAG: LuxR C-terminal-related transcriptional regulator [Trebonia sp.]|uniref:helix-turn-helix transcriptional regulator n=2 Tax=Trebonia sp. TaxID=2767075 RepID=UPI003BAFE69F